MNTIAEKLLNAAVATKRTAVPLPDHGLTVYARDLTAAEVLQHVAAAKADPSRAMATLVIAGTVDEYGVAVFGTEQAEEVGRLPYTVIEPIVAAILTHNRMTAEAVNAAKKSSQATAAG